MLDFQKYMEQRDIEARFKESRADLVQVVKDGQIQNELRFDGIDKRFDGIDRRMDGIDKRIDGLIQEVKEVKQEVKEVRQEVKEVNHRMDRHLEQTLSIKKWIIGLVMTILLGILAMTAPTVIAVLFS